MLTGLECSTTINDIVTLFTYYPPNYILVVMSTFDALVTEIIVCQDLRPYYALMTKQTEAISFAQKVLEQRSTDLTFVDKHQAHP